ncbi:MAG: winged helix-turn-helix domain-containing protein [Candidatus Kariarchaeaceae archaeon]
MAKKFRVHSVYIIVEDGRCAYDKAFSELAPSPHLVSAMLTAMQVFIKEVTGSYFSEISAGPFSFISEKAGPFSVVLVSTKSEEAIEKAKYLTLRFIRRFKSSIEDWSGETIDFQDFDEDVEIVFGPQNDVRVDPKKPLDAIALIQLKHELQEIAKYLLQKEEKTVDEIAEELSLSKYVVFDQINELYDLGYIGRFEKDSNLVYFVR